MGHNLMKEIKMRNDEYDRVTEHGLKPEMRDVFSAGNFIPLSCLVVKF